MRFLTVRGLLLLLVPSVIVLLVSLATLAMERGEENSQIEELRTVQSAVIVMMVENNLRLLPSPVKQPTADMSAFPDPDTPAEYKGLARTGNPGFVLRDHGMAGPDGIITGINYISIPFTNWTYNANFSGLVTQGPRQ
ncbi:MAG: hypothetical protein IIC87_07795 [Chloroflexi bacterium]|nr:hypothetical protein [Chloroflexota bacterium]